MDKETLKKAQNILLRQEEYEKELKGFSIAKKALIECGKIKIYGTLQINYATVGYKNDQLKIPGNLMVEIYDKVEQYLIDANWQIENDLEAL